MPWSAVHTSHGRPRTRLSPRGCDLAGASSQPRAGAAWLHARGRGARSAMGYCAGESVGRRASRRSRMGRARRMSGCRDHRAGRRSAPCGPHPRSPSLPTGACRDPEGEVGAVAYGSPNDRPARPWASDDQRGIVPRAGGRNGPDSCAGAPRRFGACGGRSLDGKGVASARAAGFRKCGGETQGCKHVRHPIPDSHAPRARPCADGPGLCADGRRLRTECSGCAD